MGGEGSEETTPAFTVEVKKVSHLPAVELAENVYCKVLWDGVAVETLLQEKKPYSEDIEWQGGIVKTPENLTPNTKLRVELWGSSAGLPDKMLGVMVLRGSAITELKGKPADEHLVKKETGHIRIGMLEIT